MSILILTGDNSYAISKAIRQQTSAVPAQWRSVAVHRYSYQKLDDLQDALLSAREESLSGIPSLTVLEGCNIKEWGDGALEILNQHLEKIPEANTLILVAAAIDKRTKVYKLLAKSAQVQEFELVKPWDDRGILEMVREVLKEYHLGHLSLEIVGSIIRAVGNDPARLEQGAKLLQLFSQSHVVTSAVVQALIPCYTQSALQLANALRGGQTVAAISLLQDLQGRGEPIQVIWATLITQFRTWVKVRAGIAERKRDAELQKLLKLPNPGRLYYLKQEVEGVKLGKLIQSLTLLAETDAVMKSGRKPDLEQVLLQVGNWMQTA